MDTKRRALSLSEELNQIVNPEPVFNDPEDDINLESSAQNIVRDRFAAEDSANISAVSKLRRKSAPTLVDLDLRYAGEKVDRKCLSSGDSDESQDDEMASDDQEEAGSDAEESASDEDELTSDQEEDEEFYSDNLNAPRATVEECDVTSGSQETSSNEMYSDKDESLAKSTLEKDDSEDNEYIQQFSNIDVDDEIAKGKAVKNQLIIWDNFLECRIKLQKILVEANKFPQNDVCNNLKHLNHAELNKCLKSSSDQLKELLVTFLKIDEVLQLQNKRLFSNQISDIEGGEDEEIPSDTDEETEVQEQERDIRGTKRKLIDSEYSVVLSKRHSNLIPIRDDTIDKWYEKTRFAAGKLNQKTLNSLEQSATKQIRNILLDQERLIKRTQLKRTVYEVIGKKSDKLDEDKQMNEATIEKEYDQEIFDDDDFYHQLLRELIERKTSDSSDPMIMGRKWIEIQKLRSKMKKKVDTKASKGRKIRYDVQQKLVNFMAPVDTSTFTEQAKDELFKSLFGKNSDSK